MFENPSKIRKSEDTMSKEESYCLSNLILKKKLISFHLKKIHWLKLSQATSQLPSPLKRITALQG